MSESLKKDYPHLVPDLAARLARDEVIFAEQCPKEKLAKIKRQDLQQYYYQYLCSRPAEGDNGFDHKLIREFRQTVEGEVSCDCHPTHDHHLQRMVVVGICDPALTEDKRGCESAISVVARDPVCGCRFHLEEWGGHVHTNELVNKICEVANRWQSQMKRFAIEDVQFQAVFKGWLGELKSLGGFPLNVELFGVKPNKRDKDLRIAGQQQYVNNGLWHMRPQMYYEDGRENWIWQIIKWPNQPKKRDRADAWGYCDDAWHGLAAAMQQQKSEIPRGPMQALNRRMASKQLREMRNAQK